MIAITLTQASTAPSPMTPFGKRYANGRDLKDPLISPLYGDFKGFPPTYLVTGTRDLFLSDTVRVHRKLLQRACQRSSSSSKAFLTRAFSWWIYRRMRRPIPILLGFSMHSWAAKPNIREAVS